MTPHDATNPKRGVALAPGDAFYSTVHRVALLVVAIDEWGMSVLTFPDQPVATDGGRGFVPGRSRAVKISPFADGPRYDDEELTPNNAAFKRAALGASPGFVDDVVASSGPQAFPATMASEIPMEDTNMPTDKKTKKDKPAKAAKAPKAPKAAKLKAERKPKAAKEPKVRAAHTWEKAAKDLPEGVTGQKRAVYDYVVTRGPVTAAQVHDALVGKVESKSADFKTNVAFCLTTMKRDGYLKKSKAPVGGADA